MMPEVLLTDGFRLASPSKKIKVFLSPLSNNGNTNARNNAGYFQKLLISQKIFQLLAGLASSRPSKKK